MNAKSVALRFFTVLKIICLFGGSLSSAAQASAWLLPVGEVKLSISQQNNNLAYRQALPSDTGSVFVTRKARQRDQQIYLEYGYSQTLSFVGKAFDSRLESDQSPLRGSLFELGARLHAPYLRAGLLPPFIYKLLKISCETCRLSRENLASLELNALQTSQNRRPKTREFAASVSLADRISMEPFTMVQQVRFTYGGTKLAVWQSWEYRFQLDYRQQYFIGQESQAYLDQSSSYARLGHSYFMQWQPKAFNFAVKLSRGTTRDNTQPHVFDSTKLEWRRKF